MENNIGNEAEKNDKKDRKSAWLFVIIVNVVIAAVVSFASVNYFVKQSESRYDAAEQSFSTTMDSMGQVAYGYLHTEQTFCDNWATYINIRSGEMNMETAVNFVLNVNTDRRILSYILDYDTLEGYVVDFDSFSEINCKGIEDKVGDAFEKAKTCHMENSHLHITSPFDDPYSGVLSVGFCHNLRLVDESGNEENAVLVRVMPISELQGQWPFPTGYEQAKLALIDGEGEFIVKFDGVEQESFFDYISTYNDLNGEALGKMNQELTSSDAGDMRYLNKLGQDSCYSYQRLEPGEEWVLIGYIAREDLNVTPLDLTIAVIVIFGFLLLMVFDGLYIASINKRLKISMEETKFASEAKTRFLSSMSHDIRTPMNAIIGMTTIAVKRIDDKEQVGECLNQITRASNHLLTLINDILDISKVESGKLSLNPIVFSLAEMIGNIISIAQPQIKEKNMDFEVHARGVKHEYIFADELRINQILINLISNAIKYTHAEGSVRLDIEEKPSDRGANMIRHVYTVTDNGMGMSEEFMKTMYNTFTRDTDSRINTIQGTGLGLAITKQMVDLMGGTIEVKSKKGEGTTFIVTLDVPIAEKAMDDLILPPLRLLVADDDDVFLESAEDTFKSMGVDADIASNGEDAVKMIADKHVHDQDYHCVIIDWKMPGMDGLETVKAIREKVGDEVSIIIISAYDWTEIEEEALKAGANGFITKPLFRSSVYNKLNELLNFDHNEKPVQEENTDDLKGINLLIAEDNDINWDIIQVMLEFCEITCERAENGQICVDKINAAPEGTYQAILMDVQMPVMNGREASETIRKSDKEYVRNIPIIAMTADAFAEDIVACKEAGMNGHVSKPLDMKKLIKELRSALHKDK